MFRPVLFAASGALALSGCSGSAPAGDAPQDTSTTADQPAAVASSAPAATPTPPTSTATQTPDVASPPVPSDVPAPPVPPPLASLSPQAQKGSAGAEVVLRTWASALENRQFDVAWQQFGKPPASRAAFNKWWNRYRTIKVNLGAGESDAAMGSLYYTAPATLTGTTMDGKPFRLKGDVVLRRVNDVDGATPAQLRWHIGTADLKEVVAP